jgi:hypothetical protein
LRFAYNHNACGASEALPSPERERTRTLAVACK